LEYKLFLDTNALLNLQKAAFKEHFLISQKTLEEIENIKSSSHKDQMSKYKARKIAIMLDEQDELYTVVPYKEETIGKIIKERHLDVTPDNIILATAFYCNDPSNGFCNDNNEILVVSDDLNCKFISRNIFGLKTKGTSEINIVKDYNEYKGCRHLTFNNEEMSYFYSNLNNNYLECLNGEYLIIHKSDGEIVDYRKWDGVQYKSVPKGRNLITRFCGKVKPRNPEQIVAFDMLQDQSKTIKVITGKMGSGKDYIMIANALKQIEEGKYDKLIYIRNALGVYQAEEIGFLPGEKFDKLKSFAMILADHLGGEYGLESCMSAGLIEIEHLGFIRGRDFKNSIVYCTEAENLSKEHVQLLIGRIGEGSSLWMNGDIKQTDSPVFRLNNGLLSVVQKLAGHEKLGYVQLEKTERSETASLVDLLD